MLIGQNRDRSNLMGLRGRDTLDGGANTFTLSGDIDEDRRDEVRYDQDARDGGGAASSSISKPISTIIRSQERPVTASEIWTRCAISSG
ncbi:hypothetical protein ACFSHQ_02835 [Gemmobacter lanyuensis]